MIVICGRDVREDNQGLILHRVAPDGGSPIDATDYFTETGSDLG